MKKLWAGCSGLFFWQLLGKEQQKESFAVFKVFMPKYAVPMKRLFSYAAVALLALSFCTSSCKKDEVDINSPEEFEAYLQDEMQAQNIATLSALLFKDGNIVHESYLGKANIQDNIALSGNNPFLLASISKMITGTAIMQLHEAGRFGLDDPINDYLPYQVQVPGYSEDITFRMLLTHTSSIADNDALLDQHYHYGIDPPVQLGFFVENTLKVGGQFYNANENFYDFAPGSKYEYSNTGSALLGALVEAISGTDFNSYCKQNIFTPLNMSNSSWRLDELTQTPVMPYNYSGGEHQAIGHYTNTDYPNGGLRSTARDMFRYFKALSEGGILDGQRILSQASVDAMMSVQIPSIDDEVGLHCFIMDKENELWGHSGGEQGTSTLAGFNRSTKSGVILFCNDGDADLDALFAAGYKLALKL